MDGALGLDRPRARRGRRRAVTDAPRTLVLERLAKRFGETAVLDDVSLDCAPGEIVALAGPNGAGKTTTVRILSTLLRPDSGRASVAGIDVIKNPEKVREIIGLSGQYAAVDEILTGYDNLVMFGQLLEPIG